MLPGATPEESVTNLYIWLDSVMTGMGYALALAVSLNGQQIQGVYHHRSKEEFYNFRGRFNTWHVDCLNNNLSCIIG